MKNATNGKYHSSSEWKKARAAFLKTQGPDHSCEKCGRAVAGYDLTVDHKVPGHLGNGEFYFDSSFENLAVYCRSCNSRKGDRVNATPRRVNWENTEWTA